MPPADADKTSARTIWRAALMGFGAGVLGGAAYLLLGGSCFFNIPLWASIAFYPGFVAGNQAYEHWHLGLEACTIIGVLAVGPAHGLVAALARWVWFAVWRRRNNLIQSDNSNISQP